MKAMIFTRDGMDISETGKLAVQGVYVWKVQDGMQMAIISILLVMLRFYIENSF